VEPALSRFLDKLRPQMPALIQYSQFGAKIYNRLVKQYPRLEIRQSGKQLNKGDWQQDDSV
jgi:hypothetical protein